MCRQESFYRRNFCQSSREAADLVLIAPNVDLERVRTEPDPYEPYRISQAIRVGDLLFVSGQAAIDEHGQLVGVGDFDAQAEQAFTNLERVLEAGGSALRHVVKVTIFLTDMAANFPAIVDLRGKWFTPPYPADTIVEVRSLYRPEVEIEIEAIAVAG
jgi:2-iminobutanoate/2-iminopropanoate deaminase